jgi:hypothetical protein
MKHLKKLSVVLMLTTLFSVTFTSCIDNEVSPVVEAIYEAQADLIAAQAGVQNAEAAFLLAQAEAEQARAALVTAQAAQVAAYTAGIVADNAYTAAQRVQYLLQLVAQTNLNVANLQNDLELAEVNFQTTLANAMATMKAAGMNIAVGYAWDYANAMQHANNLMSQLLGAKANLASAQLMQVTVGGNTVSQAYHLAQLQGNVTGYTADIANLTTAIAAMEAYIANPSTPEAVLSGLRAQKAAYEDAIDAKEIAIQVQQNKITALNNTEAVRDVLLDQFDDALVDHNDAVVDKNDLLTEIEDAQELVADLTVRKASYAADLTAATTAVTTATAAYNAAWTALGKEDAAGATPAFGAYFTIDADEVTIAAGGDKYATPANLQQVYVNARIDVLDAVADKAAYQADFDALVLTYNNAAVALAAAQLAFDNSTVAADLLTAQTAQTAAQGVLTTAQATYGSAKTAFEADPTGAVVADGNGNHSDSYFAASPLDFDLGNTGIQDAIGSTYMKVLSWKETTIGSGRYVPASYAATKYTPASLATAIAAIKADVVTNAITANSQIYLWQDGGQMPIADYDGLSYDLDAHNLSSTIPAATLLALPTAVVFVEVESDDTSVTNLYTFNVATNMLGTNNFSSRAFFTSGAGTVASPYVFNTVLTTSSTDAGYDSTPDANGLASGAADMLTAQAALWNAKLEVFKRQNAFDLGDDDLIAKQAVYDYQKELFDNGVANLAALTADVTAATTAQTAAKKAVDNAWTALGAEYIAGVAADSPKWWVAKTGHAIDATAGYDNDFTAPVVKNTLTLNAVVFNAEVAKAKLAACNAVCIQGLIDTQNLIITNNTLYLANLQPVIDAYYAVVAGLLVEMEAKGLDVDFTVEDDGTGSYVWNNEGYWTPNSPDIEAQLIAEYQVLWALEQDLDALENSWDLTDDLIFAYGAADDLSDLASVLSGLKGDLAHAKLDLEIAKQALASGQAAANAATANIAYLQALITTLEARHANTLAVAAKYKALMDAALLAA